LGLEFKLPEKYKGKKITDWLSDKGWTQKEIRDNSKIGTRTYYELRSNKVPGVKGIEELCRMLKKQPGAFLQYVPDDLEETEN